ncbi:hypothetical protein DO71_6010 [Burkholderia pseudomallei]|nr:hypothetical protein DO71_6010 [Burkholderia pseudomallei]
MRRSTSSSCGLGMPGRVRDVAGSILNLRSPSMKVRYPKILPVRTSIAPRSNCKARRTS